MDKLPDVLAGLGLDPDAPSRMEIIHPVTKEPMPGAWIDLRSWDSEVAHQHRQDTARRQRQIGRALTQDEDEAETNLLVAKLVAGWSLVDLYGKPLNVPYTVDTAAALLGSRAGRWLRGQVLVYLNNAGNWMPAFSTDSEPTPSTITG